MKHLIQLVFVCCFIPGISYAQGLSGSVVDAQGQGLAAVYIDNKSTNTHTHSNDMGRFTMQQARLGDTLEFIYLGYQTTQIVVDSNALSTSVKLVLVEKTLDLEQVVISNDLRAVNLVTAIDLETNPVNSSQEVLRKVPGLFIGQHAGGGKAEQIFLRGFDIDHGTDIAISVDGMPVNMVSHAHGQGYADLHFLIPETIEAIDFGKGSYYAQRGDFNTAGYVDFQTRESLDNSLVQLEYGQFNTRRILGMLDLLGSDESQDAYVAFESLNSDGPFESPQNFSRINVMGKYTLRLREADKLSLQISHFNSRWDASGQIPQRAVDQGLISRFGAIDDTEGGQTDRTNLQVAYTRFLNANTYVKSRIFYNTYQFELFSNFTFFLEDPERGDQIKQYEKRSLAGLESILYRDYSFETFDLSVQAGLGLRTDALKDVELSHTANRTELIERLAYGNTDQSNAYGFLNAEFRVGDFLINPGLRMDQFKFVYWDRMQSQYDLRSVQKAILSPKFNIVYSPVSAFQLYLKTGKGFHSNDARVVVAQNGLDVLPAAYSADFGTMIKPHPKLVLQAALWYLYLEQEFVYVGDAGIVEPSGRTRRMGADLGARTQIAPGLFAHVDANYTYARSAEPEDAVQQADRIPLAPDFTATGGINYRHPKGFSVGMQSRYMKNRPANEDNSIVALGYWITDASFHYTIGSLQLGVSIQNIFNQAWNESQFAAESRLDFEQDPGEEIHFTPGTPFALKASVGYGF
ncbi:MAG: TonB-dependent receptor [Saprospiraceae bacterium]